MIVRRGLTQDERACGRRSTGAGAALLTVLLASAFGRPSAALDAETLPSQYLFASWQDELPQNTVQAILQTRDGYLWIGTQGGLVRFDGVRFVTTPLAEDGSASSPDVRCLLEGPSGELWVGTRGSGLLRLEAGRLLPAATAGDGVPRVVFALAAASDGALWVGTRSLGLLRFRDGRFEPLAAPAEGSWERVLSLLEDRHGELWVGSSEGGLGRLEAGVVTPYGGEALQGEGVLSLFEDAAGRLWIGTRRSGLWTLGEARSEPPRRIEGSGGEAIMDLTTDAEGNLWLATYGRGLVRRDPRLPDPAAARAVDAAAGLSSDAVMAVFEDRERNLWAGTEGGGLVRLRDGAFRTFGEPEGLRSEQVWTLLEDRRGAIWIGTDGGGLGRLEGDRITHVGVEDGLSSDSVTALLEDRDGTLWVGSRGQGLNRLAGGRIEVFDRSDGLTNDTVLAMAQDRDGTLWLSTPASGLNRSLADGFGLPDLPPADLEDLGDDLILALLTAPGGELVMATDSGLKFLGPRGLEVLTRADGLSSNAVFSLHLDTDGTLWAGTYGSGLNRIRGREIHAFGRAQGLSTDTVLSILEDDSGQLWLGSNQGVIRVAKAQLEAVARGEIEAAESVHFGKADGLRSAECNGGYQPAAFKDRTGRLWFATIRGAASVDPRETRLNPVPPGVVVESVQVDGDAVDPSAEGRFPAGRRRFEITYTALSFAAPEQVRFRYRLEGYDSGWIEAADQRQATYTNLPADREYRFQVIAANEDGVWNEEGASYRFSIAPFFYQRPAFLLLAAAVVVLLWWSAYQLRLRRLLRRTEELEGLVAERTREVVDQRDQLRRANRELTRLNEFKSEFLGIAAHDLKNPLTVIYGDAGSIAADARGDARMARRARRISTSASQMLNIVSDLLDTTALESGKLRFAPQRLDLAALAAEVVDRFRTAAGERGIELVVGETGSVEVVADRDKLLRVCENLVSNAVRYSRERTEVKVSVAEVPGSQPPRVVLAVRDQGPGLSPAEIERIFNRFERLAEKHRWVRHSAGLGLSIVKQFVEMHGGRVWVESTPGEGAAFFAELPAEPQPPASGETSR